MATERIGGLVFEIDGDADDALAQINAVEDELARVKKQIQDTEDKSNRATDNIAAGFTKGQLAADLLRDAIDKVGEAYEKIQEAQRQGAHRAGEILDRASRTGLTVADQQIMDRIAVQGNVNPEALAELPTVFRERLLAGTVPPEMLAVIEQKFGEDFLDPQQNSVQLLANLQTVFNALDPAQAVPIFRDLGFSDPESEVFGQLNTRGIQISSAWGQFAEAGQLTKEDLILLDQRRAVEEQYEIQEQLNRGSVRRARREVGYAYGDGGFGPAGTHTENLMASIPGLGVGEATPFGFGEVHTPRIEMVMVSPDGTLTEQLWEEAERTGRLRNGS